VLETCGDRLLAARVAFTGASAAHGALLSQPRRLVNEVRNVANVHGGDLVWIEKVVVRTSAPAREHESFDDGPLGELTQVIAYMKSDESSLAELAALLEPLRGKLPAELVEGDEGLGLDQPARIMGWLDEAEPLLRAAWQNLERGE